MKQTAAAHHELAFAFARPHPQRDVVVEFAFQPVPQFAACQRLAFAPGERRIVHAEQHVERRLIDGQGRH